MQILARDLILEFGFRYANPCIYNPGNNYLDRPSKGIVQYSGEPDRPVLHLAFQKPCQGDLSMKIDKNIQIPNMAVYGVLFSLIFGIGIWLLAVQNDSPTNWILYVAMATAILAGLVKFVLHSRGSQEASA